MTLQGYIFDATTGQPIPAATVAVYQNGTATGEGTVADANGNFTLDVADPDNSQVQVSSIGYRPVTTDTTDAEAVSLFPSTNQLPGVTVTAQAPQTSYKDAWAAIKPTLPWVAGVFVLGYLITTYHDKQRKKYRR